MLRGNPRNLPAVRMRNNTMSKTIDILYITYNRIAYTRKTLPSMIENAGIDFNLTIFDNGSTDGTVEYINLMQKKYGATIRHIFFNHENIGIALPTNLFWKKSTADYVGKVDNDTLLPNDWLKTLVAAQEKSPRIGVIGGFHFNPGYFRDGDLENRVLDIDGVSMIPDAFIGGCCYIMPRHIQQAHGYMHVTPGKKTYGWTEYQISIYKSGYVNGYIWPLLYVEHFDDPLSQYNLTFSEHAKSSAVSLSDKGIRDHQDMLRWYARDALRVVRGDSLSLNNA